jgi:hypothetical protein
VEVHAEDTKEGTMWRSECQRVCGEEMKGFGFRGSGTLKKKK